MQIILEDKDRKYLTGLVACWVETVENPDKPLIGGASAGRLLSPRELVHEVEAQTEFGKRYLDNLARAAARTALADSLQRFGTDTVCG
jgi:hypothetical protein